MNNDTLTDVTPIHVDDDLLRQWPLPDPSEATDKDARGRVLLIGGSAEMPGGIVLAALGAMRAGAGKLCIATARSVAAQVAQALPEARVIALEETEEGGLIAAPAGKLPLADVDAILIGPGMQDEDAAKSFTQSILAAASRTPIVLDALALLCLKTDRWQQLIADRLSPHQATSLPPDANFQGRRAAAHASIVITPHAGEMAALLSIEKDVVENDNQWAALCAAARWKTLVAAKGATTHIAIPSGIVWKHTGGNVGLATSGSGDVLAGIITGLAARGACVEQAAVWAVRLHALAGDELQRNLGRVGYLAREIPSQIPFLMDALARPAEAESSGPSVRQLSGKETSQKNAKSQDRSRTN